MGYYESYGELEEKLIKLFYSLAPDFDAAQKLIDQGANVNAIGKYNDRNILREIIHDFCEAAYKGNTSDACEYCDGDHCDGCEFNTEPLKERGTILCRIINFFLENGFDVTKNNGCYGAQCLYALALSTMDRYMIDATKILLNAGADNRSISLDERDTPWDRISEEGSAQSLVWHNHMLEIIYETVYQIYQAIEDGKSYAGIDSYDVAEGKRILKVLAEKDDSMPVIYEIDTPEFSKENCFRKKLYLVYDDGALVVTKDTDLWTDTILPETDLKDVSEYFEEIIDSRITEFSFDYRIIDHGITYGQPITEIEFDSGFTLRFSINFGEVSNVDRAAWFELY